MKTCVECGRDTGSRNKRCSTCYMRMYRRIGTTGTCSNCQQEKVISHSNMCKSCYNYQRRTGVPRPPELFLPREKQPPGRVNRRANDNYYGGERHCIQIGCHRPSVEDAPWGMGFCKYCLPRVEKILQRQYKSRSRAQGITNG